MWSAPKQPFVLPVRIRNFEDLYKDNVNTDKDASTFEESPAIEIRKKSEERINRLAEELLVKMKETSLNILEFKEEDLTGIYYGQLFYLLKDVKKLEEFKDEVRPEEQLFIPVLSKLFDSEIVIKKGKHSQKGIVDYYCAPTEKWKATLCNE